MIGYDPLCPSDEHGPQCICHLLEQARVEERVGGSYRTGYAHGRADASRDVYLLRPNNHGKTIGQCVSYATAVEAALGKQLANAKNAYSC